MPNMTVPAQRAGAKSLPAEMRVGGFNPWLRMRAQHPNAVARGWGMRGLGDDTVPIDIPIDPMPVIGSDPIPLNLPDSTSGPFDFSTFQNTISQLEVPPEWTGPTVVAPTAATPTPPNGYAWANVLNQSGNTIAKILAISQGGSSIQLPNGQQIVYGSPAAAQAGSLSNALGGQLNTSSIMLFGGLALGFLFLMSMGNRGGGR